MRPGMEEALDHSLAMNDKGLGLMEKGRFMEAACYFRLGLSEVYARQPKGRAEMRDDISPSCSEDNAMADHNMTQANRAILSRPLPPDVLRQINDEELIVPFDRLLEFHYGQSYDCTLSCSSTNNILIAQHLLAGTLTYNTALAYHLQGLSVMGPGPTDTSCPPSGQALFHANQWYNIAYNIFDDTALVQQTAPPIRQLALAACATNIGSIHAHFGHLEEASFCIYEVSLRLVGYSPFGDDSGSREAVEATTALSVEEFFLLSVNSMYFRRQDFPTSPAA